MEACSFTKFVKGTIFTVFTYLSSILLVRPNSWVLGLIRDHFSYFEVFLHVLLQLAHEMASAHRTLAVFGHKVQFLTYRHLHVIIVSYLLLLNLLYTAV